MNKILNLVILGIMLLCGSCSDDKEDDYYYVRYSVTAEPNKQINIYYTTAEGDNHLVQSQASDGKYQYTVGPVSRGFKAELTASYVVGGAANFLMIEVSENNHPFVVKADGTDYYNLKYLIQ